jgi:hypothetical protein
METSIYRDPVKDLSPSVVQFMINGEDGSQLDHYHGHVHISSRKAGTAWLLTYQNI